MADLDRELAGVEDSRPSTALDPARERRIKALACTEPLHSLQANRGRRGWDRFDFYDLGLAAIDGVVDRMGFDTGIGRDNLEEILVREARRYAADATETLLADIVVELIESLIRPAVGEYTSALDEVRRRFDFALLTEHENSDGRIYLRATNEAINVLVGGLNTDIESAQVAAEATLEHLIRRRRLDDAARPAREAKIRSVQFASFVRQLIDETRRDVRRAGWREAVPQKLTEIREHLEDRMRIEGRLLAAMQDARDAAGRDELRHQAAVLVETVDDCFSRHQELHAMVLSAVRVYVEEQDRQVFGRAAAIGAIDLVAEVVMPVVASRLGAAKGVLDRFAEALLGFGPGPRSESVTPRLQPRFGALIQALLRPAQVRDEYGPETPEPEWEEPIEDAVVFTAEQWAVVEEILGNLDTPVRLSELLKVTTTDHGFDTADLLRLRAILATAPDLDAVRPNASPVIVAGKDGAEFVTAEFAGDDLLVGTLTTGRGSIYRSPHIPRANMTDDFHAAGQIIGFGLNPRNSPGRIPDYSALVSRYRTDPEFRLRVAALADGQGLVILDCSSVLGLVLAARGAESPYYMRLDDYAQMTAEERHLNAFALLCIAAACYPTADALEADDGALPQLSVNEVVRLMNRTAERMRDRARDQDPPVAEPQAEPLYRLVLRWREGDQTGDERSNPHVKSGMVKRALKWLANNGLADEVATTKDTFRIRSRFRLHVLDAVDSIGPLLAHMRDVAREER